MNRSKRSHITVHELESRDLPTFYGNSVFPADNPWNQRVDSAPVATSSAAIISRLVNRGNARLHPDFGNPATDGALYGIPINIADSTTPKVTVQIPAFGYGSESDIVQVPIPVNAVIEGDGPNGPGSPTGRGDSHLLVYDKSANILYETYFTVRPTEANYPSYGSSPGPAHSLGNWGAYSLSMWDLNKNSFRTLGWTSADAAGLPIMPGLVRPDEAMSVGVIDHAIRFTVSQTRDDYVFPASHEASSNSASDLPRMGERFRLKSSFVIPSNWSPEAKAVATAMKTYGLIVADNGSDMYFQGTPSTQWNMSNMLVMQSAIRASDFEVVDLTPIVTGLSTVNGLVSGGTAVTISGHNFLGSAGNLHVQFGNTPAAAFTVVSDSQIVATAPAHALGTVDITITSGSNQTDVNKGTLFFGYGTSAVSTASKFNFVTVLPPSGSNNGSGNGTSTGNTSNTGTPGSVIALTPPTANPLRLGFAVGSDSKVKYYDASAGWGRTVEPFPGFSGGIRTATADFNGDGTPDIVVGTGPGIATQIQILSGTDGSALFSLAPFEASFTGGVYIAAGDVNGDGTPDLLVTPDEGGGPRVRIFNGRDFSQLADFFGIDDPNFRGGARVAVGDINGDGFADVVVAAGFGGGPRVAAFDGKALGEKKKLFGDFLAFEEGLRNGTFIAVGDINGDGKAELIAGGGPGGGPRVSVFAAADLLGGTQNRIADFFAGDTNNRGGVRLAVKNLDGDTKADLIAGAGTGGGTNVTSYLGKSLAGGNPPADLSQDAFAGLTTGVFVG